MIFENGKAAATEETVTDGQNAENSPKLPADNIKRQPDLTILLRTVAELLPVFAAEAWQPHKPLAVGIDNALIATGILKPYEAGLLLRAYTRRRMYQVALAAGGYRFDLDGTPCEEISAEHQACAKASLAAMDRKAAEAAAAVRAEKKAAWQAEKAKRSATAVADRPEGPRPYHQATPQRIAPRPPQPADQPRRLGLADLKAAAQARRAMGGQP